MTTFVKHLSDLDGLNGVFSLQCRDHATHILREYDLRTALSFCDDSALPRYSGFTYLVIGDGKNISILHKHNGILTKSNTLFEMGL